MLKLKQSLAVVLVLAADVLLLFACIHMKTLLHISALLSPACPFRHLTGLKCPSCGGTHAVLNLMAGNLRAALSDNFFVLLLGIYLFILLALFHVWSLRLFPCVQKLILRLIHYKVVIGIGIFAGIFSIFRNFVAW